jgi:hypothetical protein
MGFKVDLVKAPYAGRVMPSVRRLTAILAADVAGYSRLMGADEEGTHERLKAHLGELAAGRGERKTKRNRVVDASRLFNGVPTGLDCPLREAQRPEGHRLITKGTDLHIRTKTDQVAASHRYRIRGARWRLAAAPACSPR